MTSPHIRFQYNRSLQQHYVNETSTSQSPLGQETSISLDINPRFAMHRLFTFPADLLQKYTIELVRQLAEIGLYCYNASSPPFFCCTFCELILPLDQLQDYLSRPEPLKIIQSNHGSACKIGERDSGNVPMGSSSSVLNFKFEAHRLYSLLQKTDWQHVEPIDLAKSGFYYTGDGDNVRCAFCNLEVRGWEAGDTPNGEHRRWNPACPLLVNRKSIINIEIGNEQADVSHDGVSKINIGVNPFTPREELLRKFGPNLHFVKTEDRFLVTPIDLNILDWSVPLNPKYATLKSRVDSFKNFWPRGHRQTPLEMARAGFYYTGKGDQAICFHCNFGLKDWVPQDDPFVQHCRWNSNCQYLLMCKGPAYVEQVLHGKEDVHASDPTPVNGRAEDDLRCLRCKQNNVNKVNLPCGHMTFCGTCVDVNCPVCGKEVISEINVPGFADYKL